MSSFTIGKKLFFGVGTLLVLTLALGVTAFYSISSIGDRVQHITGVTIHKQDLAHRIALDDARLLSLIRGMGIRGYSKDLPGVEKHHEQFNATADDLASASNTLKPFLARAQDRDTVDHLLAELSGARAVEEDLHKTATSGDMAAFMEKEIPFSTVQSATQAETDSLLQHQEANLSVDAQGALGSIDSSRWVTGILLALSGGIGVLIVFVVRGVNLLLRESVLELAESSEQIAAAANQVSGSSQSLAQGSSEQAATIEETSSVSTEINSMAQRNSENSRATAEIVSNSQIGFERTNQSLTEMVGAMENISSSSQKISKIIKVIDEIAFQTNILALNAAVEAARAGEAGMGFAVVADEVRNLAQRCAKAAQDTASLIEDSIQKSDGGKLKVDQVAVAIREITGESSRIKGLVDEINLGSVEQSRGIDQISRSITQMEQVTQSNAANAEETAAAAEELSAQAATMKETVGRLRNMVDGAHHAGSSASTFRRQPTPARRPVAGVSVKTRVAFTPRAEGNKPSRPVPVAAGHDSFPMEGDFTEF
jgi:methyl-accepting chemotaxis protein/methyl-accepting chemotaxis protein-1 (serine sensor receptor)